MSTFRKTTAEILASVGFDVSESKKLSRNKDQIKIFELNTNAISQQIIEMIKNEQQLDLFDITNEKNFGRQILRAKKIVFHPKGQLYWSIPEVSDSGGFVAIAANEIVFNTPDQIVDLAKLTLIPLHSGIDLDGIKGGTGNIGWMSGSDDGTNGGTGNPGRTGGNGKTYDYPMVYIFFQKITINIANPSITSAMQVEGIGVKGGNGGDGGDGGDGGNGMRGTPGDRDCYLGVCVCSSGPGNGGSGGSGGSGGKGGDAGRGGNGASIVLVGPVSEYSQWNHIQFLITGASSGQPGQPGQPGRGGNPGGGGAKPWECTNGGGSGSPGGAATPPNLGVGQIKPSGVDGTIFTVIRDNTDL